MFAPPQLLGRVDTSTIPEKEYWSKLIMSDYYNGARDEEYLRYFD